MASFASPPMVVLVLVLVVQLLLLSPVTKAAIESDRWRPCVEIKHELRIPCECAVTVSGPMKNRLSLEVNCDGAVLSDRGALSRLDDATIVSFSQKRSGHQRLPIAITRVLPRTVETLDFSDNAIRHLPENSLQSRAELIELRLANNALGDNVNPIFSSKEFHQLAALKILDLGTNGLRGIEEGIFMGCGELQEIYLDFNNFTKPPVASLKGPRALRVLNLAGNNMDSIGRGAFAILGETLLNLNLSNNEVSRVEDGAFAGMQSLLLLDLSQNYLQHLNSDALKGAYNLEQLDVSTNFLESFPALHHQKNLQSLNVSDNSIAELDRAHFENLKNLQVLDASRNSIGRLGSNAFADLTLLARLDLSFNVLRAIDESSFKGLSNLKWLSIQDNNILLLPSVALSQLEGQLVHLDLSFNRVAALASDSLHAAARHLTSLSLNRNLVRELPPGFLSTLDGLESLELAGNLISSVGARSFAGVEDTLLHLDLSDNKLEAFSPEALPNLLSLILRGNNLKRLSPGLFQHLGSLRRLDISDNPLYGGFPPIFPRTLVELDISHTGLRVLPSVLLWNLESLEEIRLSGNGIRELDTGTFRNHSSLVAIHLDRNDIRKIARGAFTGLRNLRLLNLTGNSLRSFAADFFDTGTGLEELELSDNEIEQLDPRAFVVHPRLRRVNLAFNRIKAVSGPAMSSLQFLQSLDLSGNEITVVEEFCFSRLARLRELHLQLNRITYIDDLSFYNSTQLQFLYLSNKIESLGERALEGLDRLEILDLGDNALATLPDAIFDPDKIGRLETVALDGNDFNEIPFRALLRQAASLTGLGIARNRLTAILTQDAISSVFSLDLAGNENLSEAAVGAVVREAKVRALSLARCGIRVLPKFEAPYLKHLNLSHNLLHFIEPLAFERTTMLELLDLSSNPNLRILSADLPSLKHLDLSRTNVQVISESSFAGFKNLRSLNVFGLHNATRIEAGAFKHLSKLEELRASDYPKLGYFDVRGATDSLSRLRNLEIEVKDTTFGDQFSLRLHPRLASLTLRGERLRSVLASLLLGVRTPSFRLSLANTNVDSLPPALLFPVPRSTRVEIDFHGSSERLAEVPVPLLLTALEERSGYVNLLNFSVSCDCEALLATNGHSIDCSISKHAARSLIRLTDAHLYCESEASVEAAATTQSTTSTRDAHSTRESSKTPTSSSSSSSSSEPVIIWTVAPTIPDTKNTKAAYDKSPVNGVSTSSVAAGGIANNLDDTLIIAIIALVSILVVVLLAMLCICRLRCNDGSGMNGPLSEAQVRAAMASGIHDPAAAASMYRPSSAFSNKLNPDVYLSSYNGSTLGHTSNAAIVPLSASPVQMLPLVQPLSIVHSTASGGPQSIYGYYDNSPIYVTSSENKYD